MTNIRGFRTHKGRKELRIEEKAIFEVGMYIPIVPLLHGTLTIIHSSMAWHGMARDHLFHPLSTLYQKVSSEQ
jgi:hypothetical protein